MNGRALAGAVLGLVVLAGCGTRVEHGTAAAPVDQSTGPAVTDASVALPGAATVTPSPSISGSPAGQSGAAARTPVTTSPAGARTPATTSPAASKTSPRPSAKALESTAAGSAQSGGGAPKPVPNQPATPSPAAAASPVLVASIGTYSGPAAATLAPNMVGAQLWVRSVNDRGGINGHTVKLIVFDDAFDPARHRAQAQEAVEQRKVVAFLSLATAVSTDDTVDYITSKRVPVIGSFGGTNGFYKSPMYFPQQSHFEPMYNSWVQSTGAQLVPLGKKKLGITYCSETPLCADIAKMYAREGGKLGLQLVYQGQGSVAQPDYTAECLSARNASAEAMVVILDGNSVTRYTSSCARQGYKPTYMLVASVILDRHKDDPNLDGAFGVTNVFPWFQSGTPATDEYRRALATYGKNLANGVGLATGWAAGKLLEQAGSRLPEPPTSEAILNGLWGVSSDLGGLTQPLSFVRDQPAKPAVCWWNLRIQKGAWTSPDGYRRHCL